MLEFKFYVLYRHQTNNTGQINLLYFKSKLYTFFFDFVQFFGLREPRQHLPTKKRALMPEMKQQHIVDFNNCC